MLNCRPDFHCHNEVCIWHFRHYTAIRLICKVGALIFKIAFHSFSILSLLMWVFKKRTKPLCLLNLNISYLPIYKMVSLCRYFASYANFWDVIICQNKFSVSITMQHFLSYPCFLVIKANADAFFPVEGIVSSNPPYCNIIYG